jgi:arginine-tRNA-protein transferase
MTNKAPFTPQQFHRTSVQHCPYLEGRYERKLITELAGRDPVQFYNELSRVGFRRSHRLAYHPACVDCSACQPVRIVVGRFDESRSIRRVARTNADLTVSLLPPLATVEQYRLFKRYQLARHGESDMVGMDFADYRAMIEETPLDTVLVLARAPRGELMGVCLVDRLDDGCSAVYSFYEPGDPRRSLGTWLVHQLVALMQRDDLPYVYLGYWIPGSPKMAYKARFKPLEAFRNGRWGPAEIAELTTR